MAYEMIGRLFSRQRMRSLASLLEASGSGFIPEAFAGFAVLLCILCSFIIYLMFGTFAFARGLVFRLLMGVLPEITAQTPLVFNIVSAILSLFLGFGLLGLLIYVALILAANSRRRKVEDVLPDFLSLSAANMRAGMTIDQAMWYAAKPEFGILSEEVSIVAKKTFGGVPFNQAVDHLPERFDSKSVRRAVALIKQGIASGGQLADILDRTAEESRQLMILRKEIASSLLMYVIFIVFAGAVGTPFLFAVSGQLVAMIESVLMTIPASPATASSIFGSALAVPQKTVVSSSDFFIFTIACSLMTAVFSSLIIGVISKGSKKEGVAYIPIMILISLAIFFLVGAGLSGFMGGVGA